MYKFLLKLWISATFFLFISPILFGQNKPVTQLLSELETATADSTIVYLNKQLGYYYQYSNQQKAIAYFNDGLVAAERSYDSLQIGNIHFSLGFTYALLSELPKSLDNYLIALRIYEKLEDSWRLVNTYMGIANVYLQNNDVEKQAEFHDRAESLLLQEKDTLQLIDFYNQKGVIYDQQKKLDSAVIILKKSLELANLVNNSNAIGLSLTNLGLTYKHQGKYKEALVQFQNALPIYLASNDPFSIGVLYNNIASTYAEQKNYKEAQAAFDQSIYYANQSGYTQLLLENYKNLASLYEGNASYKNQAEYLKNYYTLKDSLFTIDKENQLTQLESDYIIEKKNLELETSGLDLQRKKAQNITYIVLFIFSLFTAGLLLVSYKRSQKKNKLLVSKNKIINEQKATLEATLTNLKSTQDQLIQQEKLASLGQLTAGIAHEIKNPLNFVNNFSEVSIEMIEEAMEERAKSQETRDETLVDEILEDIQSNLGKIHEHGSRANGIVTSMLQHSRGGTGKKEPTDLNALIKEYTNLAFHGMRAGKNPINAAIDLQLDEQIKEVPLIGEDFSRVVLNLCNNAFDAMRTTAEIRPPKLSIRTKLLSEKILIEVEDNGPGIPDDIKDKILQPFFTTKKGTEGTGLGLSITHDIVKAHGGEISVDSEGGNRATFKITLPNK
jgi:signal transduction histidine kinase